MTYSDDLKRIRDFVKSIEVKGKGYYPEFVHGVLCSQLDSAVKWTEELHAHLGNAERS